MTRRPPVYIAAPYSGPDSRIVRWNVRRAAALARLAVRYGRAPICVHPGGELVHGSEASDPRARRSALDVDVALVRLVASHQLGGLWVLSSDAGELSEGVALELEAWRAASPRPPEIRTWNGWRSFALDAGLRELWDELADQPARVTWGGILEPFARMARGGDL